jgi:hypothetical protein
MAGTGLTPRACVEGATGMWRRIVGATAGAMAHFRLLLTRSPSAYPRVLGDGARSTLTAQKQV